MESEIHKDLIFSYFNRKASPMQRQRISEWLRQKANEEQYYAWLEEWENAHPQYVAPTEVARLHYVSFLEQHPDQDTDTETEELAAPRGKWFRRGWLIAATVVLMIGMCTFLLRNQLIYKTYETTFGETRSLQLTDGSTVILRANSRLRFPRWGFGQSSREVWLRGEANFSVIHTQTHQPFVVKTTKNVDVHVLGTEFTVFARKRGTKVTLSRGKVRLSYQEGATARQLVMKPGQLVALDARNHLATNVIKEPELHPAWSDKRFVFDETPLWEVAIMLKESYGLTVEIRDPELARRVLMGSLRADNADQLLQSISELLDIDVIREGNRVQLQNH